MNALSLIHIYLAVGAAQGGWRRFRIGEQRPGGMRPALAIAQPSQGFDARDPAGGGVDKGLEDGKRQSVDHLGGP